MQIRKDADDSYIASFDREGVYEDTSWVSGDGNILTYLKARNVPYVDLGCKDPQLTLYVPETETNWNNADKVEEENLFKEFAVGVAHELLHMKHFLEERIWLDKITDALANRLYPNGKAVGSVDGELSADIYSLCRLRELPARKEDFQQAILSSLKIFPRFQQLSSVVGKWGIHSEIQVKFNNSEKSWSVDDLKDLPYSASKASQWPSVKDFLDKCGRGYEAYLSTLGFGSDVELDGFTDLEELRTVFGPDRDGLTENSIREKLKLQPRLRY